MSQQTPPDVAETVAKVLPHVEKAVEVLPTIPERIDSAEIHATEDRKRGTSKTILQGWIQTVAQMVVIGGMMVGAWNRAEVRAELNTNDLKNVKAEIGDIKESIRQMRSDQDSRFDNMWEKLIAHKGPDGTSSR